MHTISSTSDWSPIRFRAPAANKPCVQATRIERTFTLADHRTNVFADIQNLTDRKNPEEIIYNFDYTVRKYITGLPTLAVIGARVEL